MTNYFTEKISPEFARYIYSLSYLDFKMGIYDNTEWTDDATAFTLQTYYYGTMKYLEMMIDKGYTNHIVNYKYSKDNNEGREYVTNFGCQSLQRSLRGALCSHTTDYDMNNCHPTILLYLANKVGLEKYEYSNLTEYVENRDYILDKYEITKYDVLININMDVSKSKNSFLIDFNKQVTHLKKTILENDDYKHIKTTNVKNPISSKVNKVLCNIEGEILNNVITEFKLVEVTKMFDGFMTTEKIDISDLNKLTEKYNLKWSIKPHDTTLELTDYEPKYTKLEIHKKKLDAKRKEAEENILKKKQKEADKLANKQEKDAKKKVEAEAKAIEREIQRETKKREKEIETEAKRLLKETEAKERTTKQNTQYSIAKEEFEKHCYMVLSPVLYCKDFKNNDQDDQTYSLKLMKEIYANLELEYIGAFGKIVKVPFMNEWVKDPERRQYDRRDFFPYNKNECKCPPNVFNTFTPFKRLEDVNKMTKINNENIDDVIPKAMKFIKNLLEPILMGMCEQNHIAVTHVMLTIGHMIQYPDELQQTILLFKGLPGIGKNTIFELMRSLMGSKYVISENNIKNISGDFNGMIENKLFIMIDEVSGTEFLSHKDKIKALSTSPIQTINKKGISQYIVKHYATLMLASNQEKPVTIDNKDRRYFINQGDYKNIKEGMKDKLFTPFYADLNDNEIMNQLFHYFNSMDLKDFDPRDIPKTRAKEALEEELIKPLYKYLFRELKKDKLCHIFGVLKSDNNILYINKKDLREEINIYLEETGATYQINDNAIRSQLVALGTCINPSKQTRVKNMKNPVCRIQIKKDDLLEVLKCRFFNNYKDDDIEEIELITNEMEEE